MKSSSSDSNIGKMRWEYTLILLSIGVLVCMVSLVSLSVLERMERMNDQISTIYKQQTRLAAMDRTVSQQRLAKDERSRQTFQAKLVE